MESARAFEYFGGENVSLHQMVGSSGSIAASTPGACDAPAPMNHPPLGRNGFTHADEGGVRAESFAQGPSDAEDAGPADPLRMQRLHALVAKRRSNFSYIKRMHSGEGYWLNSVRLHKSDINDFLVSNDAPWQRLLPYVHLGVSLADVCDAAMGAQHLHPRSRMAQGSSSPSAPPGAGMRCLRGALQLLEEWEYNATSSFSVQSVKFVMARNVSSAFPEPDSDLGRYTLNKFNNEILFERLRCPHTPFDVDYVEVLHSLCDVLSTLYERIGADSMCSSPVAFQALLKLDGKIKNAIISPVTKELTEHAVRRVKGGVARLRASGPLL